MSQIKSYRSGVFFNRPAQQCADSGQCADDEAIVPAFLCACLSPLFWLVAFYAVVLHARIDLGFWPYRAASGPDCAFLDLQTWTVLLPFLATLFSPIAVFTFLFVQPRLFLGRRDCRLALMSYAVLLPVAYLLAKYDPGLFLSWFID